MTSQSNPHGESGSADSGISARRSGHNIRPGRHPCEHRSERSSRVLLAVRVVVGPARRRGRPWSGTTIPVATLRESSREAGRQPILRFSGSGCPLVAPTSPEAAVC